MENIKVGLISHSFDTDKNKTIKKTCLQIAFAVKKGANLIVLQELHQNEYFCQTEDVTKFDYANHYEEDVKFWSAIAKKFNVVLVTSLFEKRVSGLYHNTAVVFEKDGSIAGKYRKMHIPDDPNFYEKFYFTPGDLGFNPIQTSVGKLGVLLCWDQWYPEASRIMALKGAEILIYPTAIGWLNSDNEEEKEKQLNAWINVQKGQAIANSLPLIAVNRVGMEGELNFWGNSFVVGPQGEELFRQNDKDEINEVVEIDCKKCEEVRHWWPFLRDRRIENYEEIVKRFID